MAEPADDEDDYYVVYDEVGTTSGSSSGPGYWPSLTLDGIAASQKQPLVSNHPLTTVRVSSGSSHTSLELPSTPTNYSSSSPSDSSSSSSVEIENFLLEGQRSPICLALDTDYHSAAIFKPSYMAYKCTIL